MLVLPADTANALMGYSQTCQQSCACAQAKVDTNKDKITYGRPDLQLLRNFCNLKFGWAYSKTDEIMEPVIKASLCDTYLVRSHIS